MKGIFLLLISISISFSITNFENPLIQGENNPDPGVLHWQGIYYAATTSNDGVPNKFAIHTSADLQTWTLSGYIFPKGNYPSWAQAENSFWAPEIHVVNNTFVAVYAARNAEGLLCVGAAIANNPLGPFTDIGAPLIINETVGSIDPTIMDLRNGTYYIVWKDDGNGNNPQIPTWIWAQELVNSSSGLAAVGPKYQLIEETLPWEGALVEAPWVIKNGPYWYLFYSANGYCGNLYAVGVARSEHPLGPYEKHENPILVSNNEWVGPGHCSVVPYGNAWVMVYHSWQNGEVCGNYNRLMMGDYVFWTLERWPFLIGGSPTINQTIPLNDRAFLGSDELKLYISD